MRSHDLEGSDEHLSSNSDSTVIPQKNKGVVSKSGTKETDNEQPNPLKKRELVLQKTGEDELPFS